MKKTPQLRVPIAKGSDEVLYLISDPLPVGIKLACVGCEQAVFAKNKGKKKRHHFAHFPRHAFCEYGGESGAHKLAKDLVELVVLRASTGAGPSPRLEFCVDEAKQHFRKIDLPIFPKVEKELILRLTDGYRRPDISMTGESWLPKCFIEVCATHAVDDERAEALRPLVGVEISCHEIIDSIMGDRELVWQVKRDLGYLEALLRHNAALAEAQRQEEEKQRTAQAEAYAASREEWEREEERRRAEMDAIYQEHMKSLYEEVKPVMRTAGMVVTGLMYLAVPALRLPIIGYAGWQWWRSMKVVKVAPTDRHK